VIFTPLNQWHSFQQSQHIINNKFHSFFQITTMTSHDQREPGKTILRNNVSAHLMFQWILATANIRGYFHLHITHPSELSHQELRERLGIDD